MPPTPPLQHCIITWCPPRKWASVRIWGDDASKNGRFFGGFAIQKGLAVFHLGSYVTVLPCFFFWFWWYADLRVLEVSEFSVPPTDDGSDIPFPTTWDGAKTL